MSQNNETSADYYNVVIDDVGHVKDIRARHIAEPPKDDLEQWHADYYAEQIANINSLPMRLEQQRQELSTIFESMTETPALIDATSEPDCDDCGQADELEIRMEHQLEELDVDRQNDSYLF